jgi:2-keto-4-pentenoate hydratase
MAHLDPAALAREMLHAYESGGTLVPPSLRSEEFNLAHAYSVQEELARLRRTGGHQNVGLKVGYANKAMWRALKLDTLVWGHMYDDTVHYGGELALRYYRNTKIEPEIVFRLREPLSTPGLDAATVLRSVEWIALGFEFIDPPYSEAQFKPVDFVAADGLHQALVVGAPLHVEESAIPQLVEDLPRFKVRIFRNDELIEEGSGKNSLRSPALCLAELAGAAGIGAGELVSSGTLTSGHAARAGETWRAEVEGLPLAAPTLQLR